MRRLSAAILVALLLGLAVGALPVVAGSSAKVVIVVGPVGDHNAHYKSDARDIAAEARKHTSTVVTLFTPNATWSAVKSAAKGASVFVYLGHGNGWPSIYPPFQTITKDGLGLDPSSGADGSKHVYYGEDYIRDNIRFAPNAVVLLYHLCYASGNTEPGLAPGTFAEARERVDNYSAGFIAAGARTVIAEGHPDHPATYEMRQLFTTKRTMDQVFRAAPTWHGHLQGPFASARTPGLGFEMDADTARPSGFYRSIVGDLGLRASEVTGPLPASTGSAPADFVVPGAAEVTDPDGVGLFGSLTKAQDPSATAATSIPRSTRLRISGEPPPASDGTRLFAVSILGTSTEGYVRATGIAPRDSSATAVWSLDHSAQLLSPNSSVSDGLVVAVRFSERVSASLNVKNAAGTTVRSQKLEGDIVRFRWPLTDASGDVVKDGAYTWTLKAKDDWGNAGASAHGGFTLDATAPNSNATQHSTAGLDGWRVSPVDVAMAAKDALSGVRGIAYRVNDGATKAYAGGFAVSANGRTTIDYRATDKAGNRESWQHLSFRIDSRAPSIAVGMSGTAGDATATWRGPVTLKPTFTDATSGVAGKLVAIDGKEAKALTTGSVVIEKDGNHVVAFTATDAAGNQATTSRAFRIDTVAPVVTTPLAAGKPPTVTPNGDGSTETVAIPFAVSEPSTVTATIAGPDGAPVRSLTTVASTAGTLAWDGRTSRGKAVPDGRYTVTLKARDTVGNTGSADPVAVDVYAALAGLARSTALFYPQDGDTLAAKASISFRLQSPAQVTVRVLDASGAVVRTAFADKALAAGPVTWTWNGKIAGGAYAKPGTYRIVVAATNGSQGAAQSVSLLADAFRLAAGVTGAVRGTTFTITARSAEPLGTVPVVVVREAGVAPWTVTMAKTSGSTWSAKITPRRAGDAGTLGLTVKARDEAGGKNASTLRLPVR